MRTISLVGGSWKDNKFRHLKILGGKVFASLPCITFEGNNWRGELVLVNPVVFEVTRNLQKWCDEEVFVQMKNIKMINS